MSGRIRIAACLTVFASAGLQLFNVSCIFPLEMDVGDLRVSTSRQTWRLELDADAVVFLLDSRTASFSSRSYSLLADMSDPAD